MHTLTVRIYVVFTLCVLMVNMVYAETDRGEFVRTKAGVAAATIAQHLEAGDDIRLNECDILGKLSFHDTAKGIVVFENCRFEHVIFFRETCFLDTVTMSNCYFHGETEFWGVEFKAAAGFQGSIFHSRPIFIHSSFLDRSDFEHCQFEHGAEFHAATFEGSTIFTRAVFHRIANFSYASFHGKDYVFVPSPTGGLIVGEASVSFYHSTFDTAEFGGANLNSAIFEPHTLSDYSMSTLAKAKSLRNLQYFSTSNELTAVRKYFREHHHRQKEREITCALSRFNPHRLETILFDLPFEYGSNLARPFKVVFGIFAVCSLIYFVIFHRRKGSGVLVIQSQPTRNGKNKNYETNPFRIQPDDVTRHHGLRRIIAYIWREIKLAAYAVFFSLLSTFNLGFRDIDFGRWLRLILPKKTDFQPFGWVRTISGLQAILSILLMGFGLLFYFGRFFD